MTNSVRSDEPLVSVVIPTRNRASYLPDALSTVRGQTYRNIEIIVVNDGSKDGTREYLNSVASDEPRLRVVHLPERRGAPAARNTGVNVSRGEFVAFQDDDTAWELDKVEKLVDAFSRSRPNVGFVYSAYESQALDGSRTTVAFSRPQDKYRGPWRVGTISVMVRKIVFESAGMFDEALPRVQDVDLWIRILAAWDYAFIPEVLARTQRVEGGISTDQAALAAAITHISDKHRHGSTLPRHDLAMMHYMFGHKLLVNNVWRGGLRQLFRAVFVEPTLLVAWCSVAIAAVLGPYPFRVLTRLRAERDGRKAKAQHRGSAS